MLCCAAVYCFAGGNQLILSLMYCFAGGDQLIPSGYYCAGGDQLILSAVFGHNIDSSKDI